MQQRTEDTIIIQFTKGEAFEAVQQIFTVLDALDGGDVAAQEAFNMADGLREVLVALTQGLKKYGIEA